MPPGKKKPSAKSKSKPKTRAAAPAAGRGGRADNLRRQRERRSMRNRLIAAGVILVAVAALVTVQATRDPAPPVESAACTGDSKYDGPSRDHISGPRFDVNPPAGGAHTADAASPRFYKDGDTIPTDGQLVHAMEHGFVVLWYQPDLGVEDMTALERLSDSFGRALILAPRRSLGGPVAVTAWHRRLLCTSIDSPTISQFVDRYTDKGPEKGFV